MITNTGAQANRVSAAALSATSVHGLPPNTTISYMIKKCDRSSMYTTTDKTLELNNFSNGKFLTEYSSFYPKKSFNKIINMNLLGNEKFVESN